MPYPIGTLCICINGGVDFAHRVGHFCTVVGHYRYLRWVENRIDWQFPDFRDPSPPPNRPMIVIAVDAALKPIAPPANDTDRPAKVKEPSLVTA